MIGSVIFVSDVTRVVDLRGGVGNMYFVHSSTPRKRDNGCVNRYTLNMFYVVEHCNCLYVRM